MADEVYDLLIIGGGINGAGIARDAALRGLRVCLVEAEDFGCGTSSRSSMLAHGGLRYLEQFELGLVHEALQERERLFRQAPHLVYPLRFFYPLYPEIASRRTVRVGLFLYDLLSHGKSVAKRAFHRPDQVAKRLPGIRMEGLQGGASYSDGQWSSVERFVLELILSAANAGADIYHHTRLTRFLIEEGKVVGAAVEGPNGPKEIRATATINAAGPWVDPVLATSLPGAHLIRKTKGSHIAVPRFLDTAVIVRATDGRTFFVLPWNEFCLIGTTDDDYQGDPGDAVATPEEVAYLQESARQYFPDAPLDDVRWTYAGVRPLVMQTGLTESNVTRKHVLYDHGKHEPHLQRLWSIQGGKLTTYRSLAEHAVDTVCRTLGMKQQAKQHPTRRGTFPGGPLIPWNEYREAATDTAQAEFGISEQSARHLINTHGAQWRSVATRPEPDALHRVDPSHHDLWCQVDHAMEHEMAVTLSDVLLRRTRLGWPSDAHSKIAKRVAKRMAAKLDWDRKTKHEMLEQYLQEADRLLPPQ